MNERRNNLGFSHLASALLAIEHFNERDPQVVPELARPDFAKENCPIHFSNSSLIADTHGRGSDAVSVVLEQVYNQSLPSAIAGGYHEEPALELSVVANSLKIPFVAYGGSNIRVVTPYYFPYSSRTSSSVIDVAGATTSFLFHLGRTDAIGVLQAASATASQLAEGIIASAKGRGADVDVATYVPPVFSGPERHIEESMMRLKETGFRTFVLIVETIEDELQVVADAANKLGLNNGDYLWLIMGDMEIDFFSSQAVTENVNVRKLLQGAGHVRALDRFSWDPSEDTFLSSWMNQNATFARKVNDKNPIEPESPGFFLAEDDYFQTILPEPGAGFLYDAIMSIGLGLCKAQASGNWSEWSVVASQQLTEFQGATGPVSFGSDPAYPGGRAANTLAFGVFNILPPAQQLTAANASGSNYVLTNVLHKGSHSQVVWKNVAPFYFADGSTSPPALLQDPAPQIYLSCWARVLGFALFGIVAITITGSAVWVYVYRNTRIVKASQPEFLYSIDFGSLLIAICIPLNSFDENYTDTSTLSRLCTATPWFVFSGVMIIYCALFTKVRIVLRVVSRIFTVRPHSHRFWQLWRINRLLQFRRVKIKVSHVLWPFILLFTAAMVVMSVWTATEGFEWDAIEVNPISGAIMGKCHGINSIAFFTPIFLLTVIPVLLTAIMAWKTRDVDSMYSESGWIAILIGVHLQVLLVAIPVLGILEGRSSNARYLGQVAVFFFYPFSTVGLIIGPKAYAQHGAPKSFRGSASGQVHVSGFSSAQYATSPALRKSISPKSSTYSSSEEPKSSTYSSSEEPKSSSEEPQDRRHSVTFNLQEVIQVSDANDGEKEDAKRPGCDDFQT